MRNISTYVNSLGKIFRIGSGMLGRKEGVEGGSHFLRSNRFFSQSTASLTIKMRESQTESSIRL